MAPFLKYFANSLIVMIASVACTTVTTILGRLRFPACDSRAEKWCFQSF